jgi:hypothetical protein
VWNAWPKRLNDVVAVGYQSSGDDTLYLTLRCRPLKSVDLQRVPIKWVESVRAVGTGQASTGPCALMPPKVMSSPTHEAT